MKKILIVLMLIIGISGVFAQDLSDYFMRSTNEIYFHEKGTVIEKRSYRIVNLDDGGIGLIEDITNLSSSMFSVVNGYAVYTDMIELSFIKSMFGERLVQEIIIKQPGEEWTVNKTDGEFNKYSASTGSITTKNGTYDDCIVIKKEIFLSKNELFATEYSYYAKDIGLVSNFIDGEGLPNELNGIVNK